MARKTRTPDLRLLLAVAPLFAACEDRGPEARHCVGPDGIYLEDERCEPAHPRFHSGAHYVHVPGSHYTGAGTHAGAFTHSTTPGSGHAAVSRGGFGSTGSAHAHAGS